MNTTVVSSSGVLFDHYNKMTVAKKIHCIGIGGIGLSALAQLLKHSGNEVSGCDRSLSPVTESLQSAGVVVQEGHVAEHISSDLDLVIYSDAVPEGHPERMQARELGIQQKSYFEALGEIANQSKCLIAVAGAHGKTSTTAMMIDVFEAAGLDPTAVVGSLRAKTKSNFRSGSDNYFIVEADEYLRHFLNFSPKILVITNIDADHLDYYKDLADVQSAFRVLAEKVAAASEGEPLKTDLKGSPWDASVQIGVAVPCTASPDLLREYENLYDYVQVMGIEKVGFQGQPFDARAIELVRHVHEQYPELAIQVDGGVSEDTIPDLIRAGATRLVVGSAIWKSEDPAAEIEKLKGIADRL